jgi:hypothetical protein
MEHPGVGVEKTSAIKGSGAGYDKDVTGTEEKCQGGEYVGEGRSRRCCSMGGSLDG